MHNLLTTFSFFKEVFIFFIYLFLKMLSIFMLIQIKTIYLNN